ncbi:uncharacterized protein LOC141524785 [Cotesia typhae]|uniref:uncharacterized protein LOC141524785 n=1 Tax=Cotesia typhae TaxID=2053667 RepID=UPI003D69754F
MRLSTVFELLLIFLLIAFAAYGRVINRDEATSLRRVARAAEERVKQGNLGVSIMSLKQATESLNKYCKCNNDVCQCCRDFHIPVVALKGPGCASIRYFEKDNLELQLSFGDNLLSSTVVNGKKPQTICVPMPGGFSKFCGRIYSIQRESDNNFKACLGLELQSSYEVEASLRVSCFSFSPEGLKLRPAEAFPPAALTETEEEDDDDDIDWLFSDDDDETDNKKDINQLPSKNTAVAGSIQPAEEEEEEEEDDDDDDDDYSLGLDAFLDIITGDDETEKKKPATAAPSPLTVPIINKPTPRPIVAHPTTKGPKVQAETSTTEAPVVEIVGPVGFSAESSTEVSLKNGTEVAEEETTENLAVTESSVALEVESSTDASEMSESNKTAAVIEAAASDDNKQVVKVQKMPVIKKIIVGVTDKKTSITSSSVNAIKNDVKKPLAKPAKPDPVPSADSHTADSENDDDAEDIEDDDEDDEDLLTEAITGDDDEEEETEANEDEEEDDNDKPDASSTEGDIKRPTDDDHEEVSDEDLLDDDDDDDDDEEEASLMSEIIGDDDDDEADKKKKKKKKKNKNTSTTEASKNDQYSITDILNRKISRRGRQSKVMRL